MADAAPRLVPSLDALAEQPEAFDSLPPMAQAALLERVEVLAARLLEILGVNVPLFLTGSRIRCATS